MGEQTDVMAWASEEFELRNEAWTDHYGGGPPPDWETPEKPTCSSAMRSKGLGHWVLLASGQRVDGTGHLVSFPFQVDPSGTKMSVMAMTGPQDAYIFDAAMDAHGTVTDSNWAWDSPKGSSFPPAGWAE